MSLSPRLSLIVLTLSLLQHAIADDGAGLDALAADASLALHQRSEAGEPLTPQYVDLMCTWSRRSGAAAPPGKVPQDNLAEAAAREALVEAAGIAWRESKK